MPCCPERARDAHVYAQDTGGLDVEHLQAGGNGFPPLDILRKIEHVHSQVVLGPLVRPRPVVLGPRRGDAKVRPVAHLRVLQRVERRPFDRRSVAVLGSCLLDRRPGSVGLQIGMALALEAHPAPIALEGDPALRLQLLLADTPPSYAQLPGSKSGRHLVDGGSQVAHPRVRLDQRHERRILVENSRGRPLRSRLLICQPARRRSGAS
mmetsp:Transcript_23092/g.52909  ORF Transcript_23092/g.52909 Transcript_23092/m.52909 type:complete len:208 (+) Transcript_23092:687-1310(+)